MADKSFIQTLSSEFGPDFFTQDPSELTEYGKDWTKVHAPAPSVVCFPSSTEQVSRLLKLCTDHGIKVVPSGGRTGLSGGAVAANGECVISLSKMNKMNPVDRLSQTVRVQAGVVTEAVHKYCEPFGLTWPVDFASKGSSQVGGNIATNAGGVKVIRYGLTRNWVLGLQVVLMDGSVLELNGSLEKNNTGVDLRQIFIGSEGTLGIITEATLKLTRLPGDLDVFFFACESLDSVFELFQKARMADFTLSAFECLSDICLDSVLKHRGLTSPFAGKSAQYVLMEVEAAESETAKEKLQAWLEQVMEAGIVSDAVLAQSPKQASELWAMREGISESLSARAMVHKHDVALPIASLKAFLNEFTTAFKKTYREFSVYVFGHIGDGNLHINIMKPDSLSKEDFVRQTREIDDFFFPMIQKYQGSVSAEHGIGLLKKHLLKYSRTPEQVEILKKLKVLFDPKNLLNPGKIF